MTNSIFLTTKKMLGIAEEYHAFDLDIITHINSVFLNLNQLGVGPIMPYQITGEEETWDDFLQENPIPGVQSYVYLKTRLLFDPPTTSFLVDNIQKQIAELEWRMNVQVETPPTSITTEPAIATPLIDNLVNKSPAKVSTKASILRDKIMKTMNRQTHLKGGPNID